MVLYSLNKPRSILTQRPSRRRSCQIRQQPKHYV
nr:MAG TPA: hypothetical protein [Caudoviricetes sp.]